MDMEVSRDLRAQERMQSATSIQLPLRLRAGLAKPNNISEADKARMYLLMRKYYAHVTEPQFLQDLQEKNDVILLRDGTGEIRGFSTLLQRDLQGQRGRVRAIFSGDTVVDKEFWGQKQLGVAFLKYLFMEKLKSPFTPVYWMLISKGYKTYLIMANNFGIHYPRFEHATPPHVRSLMDQFYGEKFGPTYHMSTGLVIPTADGCRLREGVTPITEELRAQYPRIDFFVRANPQWDQGVELACIAEMNLFMPLYYSVKKTVLGILRPRRRA